MAIKNNKKLILIIGIVTLLITGLLDLTYFQAKKNFALLSNEYEYSETVIKQVEDRILNDSFSVLDQVLYSDTENYYDLLEKELKNQELIYKRFNDGDGMFVWLSSSSEAKAKKINEKIEKRKEVLKNLNSALSSKNSLNSEIKGKYEEISSSLKSAAEKINARSDTRELDMVIGALDENLNTIKSVQERVNNETGNNEYEKALIKGFESKAGTFKKIISSLSSTTKKLKGLLNSHRRNMQNVLDENATLINAVNYIASRLRPAINMANRNVVTRIDNFNREYGRALDLAERFSTEVRTFRTVINSIASSIRSVDNEVSSIEAKSKPLGAALKEFRASGSRSSMIKTAATAKSAAEYYSSKTGIFDPVIALVEKCKGLNNRVYNAWISAGTSSRRSSNSSSLLNRFKRGTRRVISSINQNTGVARNVRNAVDSLLDSAASPFEEGKRNIQILASSLGKISSMEREYVSKINGLKSKLSIDADGKRIRNNIDIEKIKDSQKIGFYFLTRGGGFLLVLLIFAAFFVGKKIKIKRAVELREKKKSQEAEKKEESRRITGIEDSFIQEKEAELKTPAIVFSAGELAGDEIPVKPGVNIIIGRDPVSSNIVLSNPKISRQHVMISYNSSIKEITVMDMNTVHGTFVNGERLNKGGSKTYYNEVLIVTLGRDFATFTINLKRRYLKDNNFTWPAIDFLNGDFSGQLIPISPGKLIVIGRDPGKSNICLTNPKVSRVHASILYNDEKRIFTFEDLNSTYGSFVNGNRIMPGQRIDITEDNTRIDLGENGISFVLKSKKREKK